MKKTNTRSKKVSRSIKYAFNRRDRSDHGVRSDAAGAVRFKFQRGITRMKAVGVAVTFCGDYRGWDSVALAVGSMPTVNYREWRKHIARLVGDRLAA